MQDKKFCPNCGKANDINNTICNFCFTEFDDSGLKKKTNSKKDSALEKYQYGVALINNKKYEEAIKFFEEALKINPQCMQAWNKKGVCNFLLGNLKNMFHDFEEALKIDNTYFLPYYNLGVAFSKNEYFEQALVFVDKSISCKSDYYDSWYNKGVYLSNLGRYEEAIIAFDNALKINSTSPNSWFNKGLCLYYLSRFDESIECYEKVLIYDSNSLDALKNISITLGEAGRSKEALKYLDKLLKIQPRNLFIICLKAYNLATLECYEESLETFELALSIDSSYEEALKGKKRVLEELNNQNAVKKSDDTMLCPNCGAENPNNAKFCPNCGTRLTGETSVNNHEINDVNDYLKKLYDDGILTYSEYEANKTSVKHHKLFKELIELLDENAISDREFKILLLFLIKTRDKSLINHLLSAYNFYQSGSMSRGEYSSIKNKVVIKCDEITNQISQLINEDEEHSSVLEDLGPELSKGIFLQVLGDFEGSLEALNKVLRIEPNNIDALDAKGWALVCLGRWQEALDVSNEVLSVEPLRDSSLDNKGCSLMHLNRWDEAIEPLKKAVNVNPLNDYAWNNLGQTYMHFERYGEAINCFDKVLEINPEHGDAKKYKQECLQKI